MTVFPFLRLKPGLCEMHISTTGHHICHTVTWYPDSLLGIYLLFQHKKNGESGMIVWCWGLREVGTYNNQQLMCYIEMTNFSSTSLNCIWQLIEMTNFGTAYLENHILIDSFTSFCFPNCAISNFAAIIRLSTYCSTCCPVTFQIQIQKFCQNDISGFHGSGVAVSLPMLWLHVS